MSNKKLDKIIEKAERVPPAFPMVSNDTYQLYPAGRLKSIGKIVDSLQLKEDSRIVDIGTGFGYGCVVLSQYGHQVLGIESLPQKHQASVDYWKKLGLELRTLLDSEPPFRNGSPIELINTQSNSLPNIQDNSIDYVTAFFIGTYMLGQHGAFADVARILKDGGEMIVSTEGPTHSLIPETAREPIVRLASRLYTPAGLYLKSFSVIDDPDVYDKYIMRYGKE